MDSVLNIAESINHVLLSENTFEKNVGTKGPVYLSSQTISATPLVFILSNTFISNSGIYGSATIYLRIKAHNGRCGKTLLESNNLNQNSVFQKPGSILKVQCYIPLDATSLAAF